jgi:MYXO-CTERM domain-containing protein
MYLAIESTPIMKPSNNRLLFAARAGTCAVAALAALLTRISVALAAAPAPSIGSVTDLTISVATVGDPASGVLCTLAGIRGPQIYYNRSKKILSVYASVTGPGQPPLPGRPFIDTLNSSNRLTFELRDQTNAKIASAMSSYNTGASFDVIGAKACVLGEEAKGDAGTSDGGDAGAVLVEYCKDVAAGLSLTIAEAEQDQAMQNARVACAGALGDGGADAGIDAEPRPVLDQGTNRGMTDESRPDPSQPVTRNESSGCQVTSKSNDAPVFGVALTALGVASLLRRRKRT